MLGVNLPPFYGPWRVLRALPCNVTLREIDMRDPQYLTELFWYVSVVELGSFSAVAQKTGVAKSSLSRRVKNLETRLGVQLLSRGPRKFLMTSVGEDVYRNALDMLASAQAAKICADESRNQLGGLVRVAIPAALSRCFIGIINTFKTGHPGVRFELFYEHEVASASNIHIDLILTLGGPPRDSTEIVARPMAQLQQAFFASPTAADRLGNPETLDDVADNDLLVLGSTSSHPEREEGSRHIDSPSLTFSNLQTLKDAAKAGLGVACLPVISCSEELASDKLRVVCRKETPKQLVLTSQTPPFKGITPTTRLLMRTIIQELQRQQTVGKTIASDAKNNEA